MIESGHYSLFARDDFKKNKNIIWQIKYYVSLYSHKTISFYSQLQQLEEAREAEMTDLHTLTEEFSRRMGDAERRLQNVLKVGWLLYRDI